MNEKKVQNKFNEAKKRQNGIKNHMVGEINRMNNKIDKNFSYINETLRAIQKQLGGTQ